MAFLVRKISCAKWTQGVCDVGTLNADAIADLRTIGNQLSVWRIDDMNQIDIAILALAASSKTEKIEKMDLIVIPEDKIIESGFVVSNEPGDSIILDLDDKHRNLSNMTYSTLGTFAKIIMENIDKNHRLVKKGDVKKKLYQALQCGCIDKTKCRESLLKELERID